MMISLEIIAMGQKTYILYIFLAYKWKIMPDGGATGQRSVVTSNHEVKIYFSEGNNPLLWTPTEYLLAVDRHSAALCFSA